ncbi:chorismate mutase, partial [Enterobacter hormaechei]
MASSKSSKKAPKKAEPAKDSASTKAKGKSTSKAASNPAPTLAPLALADVRSKIDQIDRDIQNLIAERARFAHQVGKAKGKLAAAVDYYRPEREAQV